MRRKDMHYRSF